MPSVLAHSGHWLVNLMYIMPVVVVGGFIVVSAIRNRNVEDTPDGESATNGKEDR